MIWPKFAHALLRPPAAELPPLPHPETIAALSARLEAAAQARLGRSLSLLAMDSGGCGGCMLEVRALAGSTYELERFGLRFVDSPRQADVLLVTGPAARNMSEALALAWDAMPEPKWAVGVGDCAAGTGPFAGGYAVEEGGVGAVLALDLVIPGSPPAPVLILEGLLALLGAQMEKPAVERISPLL